MTRVTYSLRGGYSPAIGLPSSSSATLSWNASDVHDCGGGDSSSAWSVARAFAAEALSSAISASRGAFLVVVVEMGGGGGEGGRVYRHVVVHRWVLRHVLSLFFKEARSS